MNSAHTHSHSATSALPHAVAQSSSDLRAQRIRDIVEHATHLLPSQGPIKVFVHHNTLHAFEDRTFEEGVLAGLQVFGCEPYFSEQRYREEMARERILEQDIVAELLDDLGDDADCLIASFGTRYNLRLAMLHFPIHDLPERELQWLLAESEALWRFQDSVPRAQVQKVISRTRMAVENASTTSQLDSYNAAKDDLQRFDLRRSSQWSDATWEAFTLHSLWRICREKVISSLKSTRHHADLSSCRHRDLLTMAVGQDSDSLVHDVLVRFCSVYLDQGFATWEMPNRLNGFLAAFTELYSTHFAAQPIWMKGIQTELRTMRECNVSAVDSIIKSLELLGVSDEQAEEFIESTLLALRGWAGMIWQMETSAPWTPRPAQPGTLLDFLAVRLILDRYAVMHVARTSLKASELTEVRSMAAKRIHDSPESGSSRAFAVFQIMQAAGCSPEQLVDLNAVQWKQLLDEIAAFNSLQRRRIFHFAYERRYRTLALDALKVHVNKRNTQTPQDTPTKEAAFQVITCIDDREESFRRHLEEVEPNCETYGAAGFFAVVMYYRGAAEAHYRPLCPINIVPRHYVTEEPLFSAVDVNEKRSQRRRIIGRVSRSVHSSSRTMLGGLVTAIFGSIATFPLVARILAPHITARIRSMIGGLVSPPATELHLQRETPEPGPNPESLGYTISEMAGIVIRILQDIGLVKNFSPIVLFLGMDQAV